MCLHLERTPRTAMLSPNRTPLALCALMLLTLCACKEKQSEAASILIRIDQRTVSLDRFRQDFAKSLPPDQKQLSADERSDLERAFLVQVIDRQLALAEAERRGVTVSVPEVDAALQEHRRDYPEGGFEQSLKDRGITLEDWRAELQERLLMEKVGKQAAHAKVTVGDDEIRRFFQENRSEFDRPAQVRARQIVVGSEEEGRSLLTRLRKGESFAELAKQHSLSPDAEQGGDLGFFGRGEMPAEFDAAVFNLPIGKLSDLIHSEYGYHIFLVEEKRDAIRLTLSQVQDEIRDKLRAEKEETAYEQWLQELRKKAKIDVNWSLLNTP